MRLHCLSSIRSLVQITDFPDGRGPCCFVASFPLHIKVDPYPQTAYIQGFRIWMELVLTTVGGVCKECRVSKSQSNLNLSRSSIVRSIFSGYVCNPEGEVKFFPDVCAVTPCIVSTKTLLGPFPLPNRYPSVF